MQYKTYTGQFNLNLLHEQLAEIPGYVTVEDLREFETPTNVAHYVVSIPEDESSITLGIEDQLEFPDQLIERHNPKEESAAERRREEKISRQQSILAKLGITEEELSELLEKV